ncbi:MAG: molybdenum cofactor biosynthesis protein MoaE [Pedosphaera sp.]|nr:molybdenum cofactor biosynthesis protein MoaE [Pedosphaera sp.]
MHRELVISEEVILEGNTSGLRRPEGPVGAVITFLGVVRGTESGQSIAGLEYSAFVPMAEAQFHKLFDEADQRWPLHSVRLLHRLGPVGVGQISLWIEVGAAHRAEAFAACQWLIDEMKRVVPIWKKVMPILDVSRKSA